VLRSEYAIVTKSGRPVIERPDGTWRGIQQGVAVQPSVVSPSVTTVYCADRLTLLIRHTCISLERSRSQHHT